MYKIYINNNPLILVDFSDVDCAKVSTHIYENPNIQTIKTAVSELEKGVIDSAVLKSESEDDLLSSVKTQFELIDAAGGIVKNSNGEILMIFRRGMWDLPKGKVEEEESIEEAAIREVKEECGIDSLEIIKALIPTFHTYEMNKQKYFKTTYWYEMRCDDELVLTPQVEEDITEVKWMSTEEVENILD
ncbi:NUDIX domain-containing protein, partial [Cytophagaceae bacterium AH-315-L13]|nr:NUDIX domain-containing protein [Cytophagaceae bacterium AH-315-L13]